MRSGCIVAVLGLALLSSSAWADALADGLTKVKVESVISLPARAFRLQDVRLLEGPFQHAMDLDRQYLLALEVDQLLHNFRVNAGLPSSAQPLGGWEEPKGELRGHFVGHYLTACALMYASTGDERVKAKGDAVDRVNIADRNAERQHGLQGEKTQAGDFNERQWRHATDGGWFSYTLKVLPDQTQELLVTYWGSDAGGRAFDILIDGRKLVTQKLENNWPGQFHDQAYPLPKELTEGKASVTVKFQAHPGQMAGGVFGCAILKLKN